MMVSLLMHRFRFSVLWATWFSVCAEVNKFEVQAASTRVPKSHFQKGMLFGSAPTRPACFLCRWDSSVAEIKHANLGQSSKGKDGPFPLKLTCISQLVWKRLVPCFCKVDVCLCWLSVWSFSLFLCLCSCAVGLMSSLITLLFAKAGSVIWLG